MSKLWSYLKAALFVLLILSVWAASKVIAVILGIAIVVWLLGAIFHAEKDIEDSHKTH